MKELPKDYEICDARESTHVWITGRGMLCGVCRTQRSTVCAEVSIGEPNCFERIPLYQLKLTTDFEYCRKRKPLVVTKEFRVGSGYDRLPSFYDFKDGTLVRVTVEEVLPNE
jgi:hypothetical protein